MKIVLQKTSMLAALSLIADIVSTRSSIPFLGFVYIKATAGLITLRSTNLDIEVECSIGAKVEVEGEVLIPAKKAVNIIKELSDEELVLSFDKKKMRCVIESGSSCFQLLVLDTADFSPKTVPTGAIATLQCSQLDLCYGLSVVQGCASSDENRYILNSCLLDVEDGVANLVATDGRRLAKADLELAGGFDDVTCRTILPLPLVVKLKKDLGIGETATITIFERQIRIKIETDSSNKEGFVGDILITGKVVEGKYPNYKKVFPKEEEFTKLTINRDEFIDTVNRVALVIEEGKGGVRFDTGSRTLKVSGSSTTLGESEEAIPLKEDAVPSLSVCLNPKFFKEMGGVLNCEDLILGIKDSLAPIMLESSSGGYTGIIMPLRL